MTNRPQTLGPVVQARLILHLPVTDDAADFGDVSGHTEVAAHILLDIFLLLCTLLLLNLLIAFLTDAYAQVSENKDKAFALANAEAVVELAEQARNSIRCASSRR